MTELPDNHVSKFRAEWWNERRKRDYYVDDAGCVQLRPDSPTGQKFCEYLTAVAEWESIKEAALERIAPDVVPTRLNIPHKAAH